MRSKGLLSLLIGAIVIMAAFSSVMIMPHAESSADINAPSALLMDYSTGRVLFEKNAKAHRPIASMVKIMTLILTFESIESGSLTYSEQLTASENAAGMGGSQAFLDARSNYSVDELVKSIIVASANDCCVVLAESLAGSVEGFVKQMNAKAAELGMNDTNFINCTGLPALNQYSCAYDSALMLRRLLSFSDYYNYSSVWMFDLNHPSGRTTMLTNTNKLVRFYEGCDGGKTGFTSEAKYCLAATARRGDTRLISVILGSDSSKSRNAEICKLFDYGFGSFETRKVIFSGSELPERLCVPSSREKFIPIAPATDEFILIARGESVEVTIEVTLNEVAAPLAKGSSVGIITATGSDGQSVSAEVITLSEVTEQSFSDIFGDIAKTW